jgi:hypothetical protein
MIARGLFPFYPPRSHASSCFPSKSFVSPTCKISFRNSFVSPTYAKTGGCIPSKMSARRHFLSLFSQSPLSPLFLFNRLRTLSFSGSQLSRVLPTGCALFRKKPGVHPLVIPISKPSPTSIPQILRPSLHSALCAIWVSAVHPLFFLFVPLAALPCPSSSFPLQWEYPFPVITGENQ